MDTSSRLAGYGLAALALSFTGALLLVVDVVAGRTAGIIVAVGAFLLCGALWLVLPQALRRTAVARSHPAGKPPRRR